MAKGMKSGGATRQHYQLATGSKSATGGSTKTNNSGAKAAPKRGSK